MALPSPGTPLAVSVLPFGAVLPHFLGYLLQMLEPLAGSVHTAHYAGPRPTSTSAPSCGAQPRMSFDGAPVLSDVMG